MWRYKLNKVCDKEEARTALRKAQKEMKRQADRGQREVEEWKKGDRVMLSTKNLVFKKRSVKKLTERYIVEEVISKNVVKLKLPVFMRIHLVVNISRVVRYKKLIKRQKVGEPKSIEVNRVEE